jgi:hypothetical protein
MQIRAAQMRVGARSAVPVPRSEWSASYLDSVCFVQDTDVFSADEKEGVRGGTIRRLLGMESSGKAESCYRGFWRQMNLREF